MINVIGLGYIGLPTALMMASHGVEVVGTDYNKKLVDTLNAGHTTFKEDGLDELFNAAVKAGIKEGLEGLAGKIPGLLEVRVYTDALPSSANADLMLDTTFTDAAALKGYSTHPAHVAVADGKVRPYTAVRTCLDFNV